MLKTKQCFFIAAACCLLMPAALSHAAESDAVLGLWNNEDGDARTEIFRCGEKYCGKLTWLKEPVYTIEDKTSRTGKPKLDDNNPDPALRNRPLMGLQIMHGFVFSGKNVWEEGSIYDPDEGKTYSAKITLVSPDKLRLRGFLGISLIGRTTTWIRAGHN